MQNVPAHKVRPRINLKKRTFHLKRLSSFIPPAQ